jgi:hypothetical protein
MARNSTKFDALTAKQVRAIEALLREPTIGAAAKSAKVGHRTIYTWLNDDPVFVRAYREARRQVVEKAIAELQAACSDAVQALTRNLKCGLPAVEVSAAKTILDQAAKGIELSDIVARLEEVERTLSAPVRKSA